MQQINTFSTNSTSIISMNNNQTVTIALPSTLMNSMLNFNYELNGVPVVTGITGSLSISGQYKNGRIQPITVLDLSDTFNYKIVGKYTQLILNLSSLGPEADTLIVYVDQLENI